MTMATIERTYTVPLRAGYRNAPAYYRTNKAVSTLRKFIMRHMKAKDENIKMGQQLNELLWKHGIKNPPARVTITVKKTDDGIVTAELVGKDYKGTIKPQAKSEEPQGLKEKLTSALKKDDKKADGEAEEAKPEAKKPKEKPRADVRKAPQPKAPKQASNSMEE